MTLRCSPYHTNSAFHPVIEHFKRLAGWQLDDDIEARLSRLEAALEPYNQPLAETVPLLASLLSLPLPEDRYPPLATDPAAAEARDPRRGHLHVSRDGGASTAPGSCGRTCTGPISLLWSCSALLIEQVPTASVYCMVLTARPEFVPPWPARSHITPITLNRLERPACRGADRPHSRLCQAVARRGRRSYRHQDRRRAAVRRRADQDHPRASDILRDTGDRFELTGPLSSLSIPDTLQESLMARLDRLPQVRELAQLGSVLGREFAYEMISGLSSTGESALQEGLGQLVDAELLYQRGRPPRAKYIFKHALIQDAAYGSLLRRTRQQYHLQAAELLETSFPEIVENNPEIIAHHYSEANVVDRAVDYFHKAGEQALRISANAEAIAHLSAGLEVLGTIPDGPEPAGRELELLTTMGPALIASPCLTFCLINH